MKVIHINYDAGPYGIGTFLISLLEFQKNNFEDINVAIAFHAEHKDICRFKEITNSVFNLRRRSARDIRLIFGFYNIIKNFDIVNLHTFSPWAFLAAWLSGKKIIYTFHGAFGFKERWTDLLIKLFYRFVLNKYCKKITFASATSLSIYLERLKCKLQNGKIEIFPYGLQVRSIKSCKSRKEVLNSLGIEGRFVVGTAARMDPVKRIERLIEAFFSLPSHKDFELLIVGSGDKIYQNYLVNLVRKYKLQGRVQFIGYREDIYDLIGAFDFFVLPSNYETFGLVLLEAMALGVPSAVFKDGGGAVDIMGNSGFVVNSPQGLSEVIMKLKEDNLLRDAISRKVKDRALQFDIKYTARNFCQIYRELFTR